MKHVKYSGFSEFDSKMSQEGTVVNKDLEIQWIIHDQQTNSRLTESVIHCPINNNYRIYWSTGHDLGCLYLRVTYGIDLETLPSKKQGKSMFDVSITWVLVQAKTTQFSEESTFERKRIISQKILNQKF